ncbi:3-deoxy-manno-octulosonate cytidylyltransferase [Thioalkalivibrio sp. ALE28]|uniref:3-deoxy-manno-octulosonate cytidylyltransferase n=1 Tax=Thioalkalivibrio sp. ALE28 TaxID=1158179 RepID=UPI0009DB64D1|nr:3-deoxy-manno-octulosonate cytidylyltransferase [Thioalkalivibrio sp. ALE28]
MDSLIVIPARFSSSRFPGKPLVEIKGKSMLRRVWERCAPVLGKAGVVIATDDGRIVEHCEQHGMRWVLTSSDCMTGTDRVAEVAKEMEAGLYVNVQGDEPLVEPGDIEKVIEVAGKSPGMVVNAMCPITDSRDYVSLTVPKVVVGPDGRLLYMSRAAIPGNKDGIFKKGQRQVCIYGFPPEPLRAFAAHECKTPLEKEEDIEILRFLELGYDVRMVLASGTSIAVDVPEDVTRVERALEMDRG